MLFVPLPFVVALLLAILFAVLLRGDEGGSANRPFLALIALCTLQSAVVGLRWGYGITELRYALPIIATCLPPLVFASFRSLTQGIWNFSALTFLTLAAPPLFIVALFFTFPLLIDAVLIIQFIAYAAALVHLRRSGPDALDKTRFDGTVPTYRALRIAAASLCISALFDLIIFLDFEWTKGANASLIVGNGNLFGLLLIGLTAMIAGRNRAEPESDPLPAPRPADADDDALLDQIEREMIDRNLFRDENLNLSRLARRIGIPARQISSAINRHTGKNVSQYVNDFRIAEACRLLACADISVTAAMFESGFQTKSNFNREFRRVTGLSPAAWREKQAVNAC